jgi:dipeptidyl aminopeptidase/acylaminoacyl peptidase
VTSPDGRRAIVERNELRDMEAGKATFGMLDLARGTIVPAIALQSRQPGFAGVLDAVWAPDGGRFAFTGIVDEEYELFVARLNAAEPPERLAQLPGMQWAEHWSADGRFLLYSQTDSPTDVSLWAWSLDDNRPIPLVQTRAWNEEPQLSPDGRWLAFSSNETGRHEIYVQPFGRTGERWRLTTDGGSQPKWRADGRELFYLAGDGTLMTIVMNAGQPAAPKLLFRTPVRPIAFVDQYAPTPDGSRFLMLVPEPTTDTARLHVVTGWEGLVN